MKTLFNHHNTIKSENEEVLSIGFQFVISIITLTIYLLLIQQFQGQYFIYIDQLYYYVIQLTTGLILLTIFQLDCLNYKQVNIQDTNLLKKFNLKKFIIPTIINNNYDFKQKFEKLISVTSIIDILRIQSTEPQIFIEDFLQCVQQHIQVNSVEQLNLKDQNLLLSFIDKNKKSVLDRQIFKYSLNDFNTQIKKLSEVYINNLCQIQQQNENNLIDYNYFLEKLNIFIKVYNQVKINKTNQIDISSNILNITKKSSLSAYFENSEVKIKNNQQNQDNSYYNKLSHILYKEGNYSFTIDNILAEQQYDSLNWNIKPSNDIVYDKSSQIIDTKYIYNLIENKIGIINQQEEKEYESQYKDDEIEFKQYTRIALDKTTQNTLEKIKRKSEYKTHQNIPWFKSLIKDQKRLSITFQNFFEMEHQFKLLQKYFGFDYNKCLKLNDQLIANIIEIKNSFKHKKDDYKDIKIILQIENKMYDTIFNIEIQCHIIDFLQWKICDHRLQNFSRIESNVNQYFNDIKKQEFYESKYRFQMQILTTFIKLIGLTIVIYSFIMTYFSQIRDQNILECQNGNYDCLHNCLKDVVDKSVCKHQFERYQQNLELSESLNFCSKFNEQDLNHDEVNQIEINQICYSIIRNSNLYLVQGNDICYHIPNIIFNCVNNDQLLQNSKISSANQEKAITSFDSQVIFDKNKLVDYYFNTDKYFHEKIFEIIKNENINNIKIQNNSICLEFSSNLQCSFGNYYNVIEQSIKYYHLCLITSHFELLCSGSNSNGQISLDQQMTFNSRKVSTGSTFTCSLNIFNELNCAGKYLGGNQIPNDMKYDNLLLDSNSYNICTLSLSKKLNCYGDNIAGISDIPQYFDELNIMQLQAYSRCICVISSEFVLYCLGEIPNNIEIENIQSIVVNSKIFVIQDLDSSIKIQNYFNDYSFQLELQYKNLDLNVIIDQDFLCGILINTFDIQCQSINNSNYEFIWANKNGDAIKGGYFSQQDEFCQLTDKYKVKCESSYVLNFHQDAIEQLQDNFQNQYISRFLSYWDTNDILTVHRQGETSFLYQYQQDQSNIQLSCLSGIKLYQVNHDSKNVVYWQRESLQKYQESKNDVVQLECSFLGICVMFENDSVLCDGFQGYPEVIDKKIFTQVYQIKVGQGQFCLLRQDLNILCQGSILIENNLFS